MKPIALGGFFILSAIYLSLKNYENGFSRKRCSLTGICLGLACTCSYLSAAFLPLPLIVALFSLVFPHAKKGIEAAAVDMRLMSSRQVMGIAGSLLLVVIAIGGWHLLSYEKEFIIQFAGNMYARQDHALPFDYHLPAIDSYLLKIRSLLLVLAAGGLFLAAYFAGRRKLMNFAMFQSLPCVELTYLSAIGVIFVILSTATMLNHLVPLSLLNFLKSGKDFSTINGGYYGMYPGDMIAPSFFSEIFPQCIGSPLLIWAGASLILVPLFGRIQTEVNNTDIFFCPVCPSNRFVEHNVSGLAIRFQFVFPPVYV